MSQFHPALQPGFQLFDDLGHPLRFRFQQAVIEGARAQLSLQGILLLFKLLDPGLSDVILLLLLESEFGLLTLRFRLYKLKRLYRLLTFDLSL